MKKVIKFIRNNILGLLVGLSLCLNGVIIAENMITSEQVSYSNDKTSETTVKGNLDELFSAVDINERLGTTDISSIGNGTITGALSLLKSELTTKSNNLVVASVNVDNISIASTEYYKAGSISIIKEGYTPIGVVGYQINNATVDGNGCSYAILMRCITHNNSSLLGYTIANSGYNSVDLKVSLIVYVLYVKN